MSSEFTVTVTHPTNQCNGAITISGPTGDTITYSLNGSTESSSATVPVKISNLPSGTHTLKVNVPDTSSGTSFTTPVTLASCLSLSSCSFSSWFWVWFLIALIVFFAIAYMVWSRRKNGGGGAPMKKSSR